MINGYLRSADGRHNMYASGPPPGLDLPSKHETFTQCWLNVGPASKTVDQHWASIGWTSRVCWVEVWTFPCIILQPQVNYYICIFTFLLAHYTSAVKYVKLKTWHKSERFLNRLPSFSQIWIIFTHLKLWITSAKHNFKWVKFPIYRFGFRVRNQ